VVFRVKTDVTVNPSEVWDLFTLAPVAIQALVLTTSAVGLFILASSDKLIKKE
jgi:hypothetical protein